MKSLPLAVAFLLLVFSQFSGIVRADLVDDVCMRTDFPAICTSTLRSDPGSASADVKGLARIVLPVVLTKTNETFAQVQNLLGQTSEPVLKAMLSDCSNDYGVRPNMEDVAGGAESCEELFSCADVGYVPGKTFCQPRPSPLTDRNHLVYALARIAQDITATFS
ncbi:hypothetical protein FH972_006332 [Carpinus fangiana]|uniref:Pectinesterase inhibitor domain-containing protein n=1 Tax=Carpinus fangiana TaxID=176857 RepID=A0A5N6QRY8_9ROSI|nr:hypothetical protein FH972_006332 [Carpinus fangiana]